MPQPSTEFGPSRDLARLCDAALRAGGALVALVAAPAADVPDTTVTRGIDEEEWMMQLSPDGASWFQPVSRRQVVSAGARTHRPLLELGSRYAE